MSNVVRRIRPRRSIYAEYYVKLSHRAKFTPRTARFWRPRVIAWAGPNAFYDRRFYYLDKWYKARIAKPEIFPDMHVIDPDTIQQSLAERLAEKIEAINLGFKPKEKPEVAITRTKKEELELARLTIQNKVEIDLSKIPFDQFIVGLLKHHRVFSDLFMPGAYFNVTQDMKIFYDDCEVLYGNQICASKALKPPKIKLESLNNPKAFNTLFLLNIDGDCFESEQASGSKESDLVQSQMIHWLIANIPDGAEITKGEELVPYLQPIPIKGTGYHRIAFVLFRHKEKLDLSEFKPELQHLSDRVFRMHSFYLKHQSALYPTSVKLCQMKWHESCGETLKSLGMKIPHYYYEWAKQYPPRQQREFPEKHMPFNLYFEQYRNPEAIRREMNIRRLEKLVHEGTCEPKQYPDIQFQKHRIQLDPWVHTEIIKQNVGAGKYSLLYQPDLVNAAEQAEMENKEAYEKRKLKERAVKKII